jgi:hypothetical protein
MVVMQATEFDVSWRNLRHEQAFAAAESGIAWGVNQLFINGKWRTTAALNCTNNASWVMFNLTRESHARRFGMLPQCNFSGAWQWLRRGLGSQGFPVFQPFKSWRCTGLEQPESPDQQL